MDTDKKLTPAQKRFLAQHDGEYVRPRYTGFSPKGTYDFVGRLMEAGYLEIIDGSHSGWPYTWEGTKLTDKGREAVRK